MSIQEKITVSIASEIKELIPGFLDNRRNDVEKMRQALEQSDFEPIRIIGHSMKGVGGGYGFDAITDIGAIIEQAAKRQDAKTVSRSVDELEGYLDRLEVVFE